MFIELRRTDKFGHSTLGELYVNEAFQCYVCEDAVREVIGQPVFRWKIKGETAIPVGTYQVIITMSNRFKKLLPEILNVPGYSGVRIHSGNTHHDTEGCLLVGEVKRQYSVGSSRVAMALLQPKIQQALDNKETVSIKIS